MSEPIVTQWVCERPTSDVRQALERLTRLEGLARMAVMPDVHLGESVCIGCVLGVRDLIYPSAVGGDIGCGIATVRLDAGTGCLAGGNAREALAVIGARVPL